MLKLVEHTMGLGHQVVGLGDDVVERETTSWARRRRDSPKTPFTRPTLLYNWLSDQLRGLHKFNSWNSTSNRSMEMLSGCLSNRLDNRSYNVTKRDERPRAQPMVPAI